MTTEVGAYFFDSSLLNDKSELYLTEAQKLVNDLLESEKYKNKRLEILSRKQQSFPIPQPTSLPKNTKISKEDSLKNQNTTALALVSNPDYQFKSSQEILAAVSNYKKSVLEKSSPKYKRPMTRTQFPEYLNLSRLIFKKVNQQNSDLLGKRGEVVKETISEINSKRFENQEQWLEKYLELQEEIKGHRLRIMALKKALRK